MTTLDETQVLRVRKRRTKQDTIIGKVAPAARAAMPVVGRWLRRARTALLTVSGLGLITAAAWTIALPLGLLVGGVSLLVLQYLTAGEDEERS